MNTYIFLTTEGYTFQPDSQSIEPDVENLQVLGFANGYDQKKAFSNLLKNNPHLLKTNFRETFCYQLDSNYTNSKKYFYLPDLSLENQKKGKM